MQVHEEAAHRLARGVEDRHLRIPGNRVVEILAHRDDETGAYRKPSSEPSVTAWISARSIS
jgi:hypothetical protein